MEIKSKIQNGIYLIVDPSMKRDLLLDKLASLKNETIAAVQIWDNFDPSENPVSIIENILYIFQDKNTPVLINNRWEFLKQTELNGVHFDTITHNINHLKSGIDRDIIIGITCNNDLSTVRWAAENELDYISFCSMFPSSTANSCELVNFNTIKEARHITSIPIFLAGGIKPENIGQLGELNYSGIAVVSGIMGSENPIEALKNFQQQLKNNTNEN